MVYKLGTAADLSKLPKTDKAVLDVIKKYLDIFDDGYGENRNIESEGGYILYAPMHTPVSEINTMFPYDRDLFEPEYVENIATDNISYCASVFLIGDDFGVVVVMAKEDAAAFFSEKTAQKYKIRIRESLEAVIEVEAENKDDAVAVAMGKYYACEIVLGSEHFTGVSFDLEEDKNDN